MTDLFFGVLGALEVSDGDTPIRLHGPKQRVMLGSLVTRENQFVSVEQLVDDLWDVRPPPGARETVQNYIGRLRRTLQSGLSRGDARGVVRGNRFGYKISASDTDSDLRQFERLAGAGKAQLDDGAAFEASRTLSRALSLRRGRALLDVPSPCLQATVVPRIEERWLSTLELRIEADLRLGRHHELVAELEQLTAQHPERECMQAQRMLALYRAGRQTEALEVYQTVRKALVVEFGLEPGAELKRLEKLILASDSELDVTAEVSVSPRLTPCPRQLPADIDDFTGREGITEAVMGALDSPGAGPVPIVVLVGQAGVGKSTLAVRAAHRLQAAYPDGQLHVDLRRPDGSDRDPGDVLAQFLRAWGVTESGIPRDTEERCRLYRTLLSKRRVLVVLDNAVNDTQIRPLLPGSADNGVIVTSRRRLFAIAGAHHFELEEFSQDEALRLLSRMIGESRCAADYASAVELVNHCGKLPLAVRVAAVKLASRPHWTLARAVDRLSLGSRRLNELTAGDVGVRACITSTYDKLTSSQQGAFRLLGTLPPGEIPVWALSAMSAVDVPSAEETLEHLADVHLLRSTGVDRLGGSHFRVHDLVRDLARERCEADETDHTRHVAHQRLVEVATAMSMRAVATVDDAHRLAPIIDMEPWEHLEETLANLASEAGRTWLIDEWHLLIWLAFQAHHLGLSDHAWRLSRAVHAALSTVKDQRDVVMADRATFDGCRDDRRDPAGRVGVARSFRGRLRGV